MRLFLLYICSVASASHLAKEIDSETIELKSILSSLEKEFLAVCAVATRMMAPDKSSVRYFVKQYFVETVCSTVIETFEFSDIVLSDDLLNIQVMAKFNLDTYLSLRMSIEQLLGAMEIGDSRFFVDLPEANPLKVAGADFSKLLSELKLVVRDKIPIQQYLLEKVTNALLLEFEEISIWDESRMESEKFISYFMQFEDIIKQIITDTSIFAPLDKFKQTTIRMIELGLVNTDLNSINTQQKVVTQAYADFFYQIQELQEHILRTASKHIENNQIDIMSLLENLTSIVTLSESAFEAQKNFRRKILKMFIDQSRGVVKSVETDNESVAPKPIAESRVARNPILKSVEMDNERNDEPVAVLSLAQSIEVDDEDIPIQRESAKRRNRKKKSKKVSPVEIDTRFSVTGANADVPEIIAETTFLVDQSVNADVPPEPQAISVSSIAVPKLPGRVYKKWADYSSDEEDDIKPLGKPWPKHLRPDLYPETTIGDVVLANAALVQAPSAWNKQLVQAVPIVAANKKLATLNGSELQTNTRSKNK